MSGDPTKVKMSTEVKPTVTAQDMEVKVVHSDIRGTITEVRYNGEFDGAFFSTRKGFARGGEWNDSSKGFHMTRGEVLWALIENADKNEKGKMMFVLQKQHETLPLDRGVAHLGVSLSDSIFYRWFDNNEFNAPHYVPELRKYATGEADVKGLLEEAAKSKTHSVEEYNALRLARLRRES